MRFYLVDRITGIELGKSIEGIKCWSLTNEIFNDHFPGLPIVPGVLVIESMAQLLGALIEKSHEIQFQDQDRTYAILSIVHKAKFKSFMIPGDRAVMKGELLSLDYNMASGKVDVFVDEKKVAQAELSFACVPRKTLPNQRLVDLRQEYYDFLTKGVQVRDQRVI